MYTIRILLEKHMLLSVSQTVLLNQNYHIVQDLLSSSSMEGNSLSQG